MNDEIKLPPLPDYTLNFCSVFGRKPDPYYSVSRMEEYARDAVLADRAARPVADAGVQRLDLTDYRTPARYANGTGRAAPSARTLSDFPAPLATVCDKPLDVHRLILMYPTQDELWRAQEAILAATSAPAEATQGNAVEVKPGEKCPCGQKREWCIANDCPAPAEAPSVRDQALEEAAQVCDERENAHKYGPFWNSTKSEEAGACAAAIRALQGKPEAAKGGRHG